tara:strand:+ start:1431 stop:1868 length:438 start_codon:yes stop_codon:yes gene_type:complete
MKISVINGPNLNLLGKRKTEIYGKETIVDIEKWMNSQPVTKGHFISWFQSNHEGNLIEKLHSLIDNVDGIIINPGAFTHYSYAIRDAIEATNLPAVEVHLSDIHKREKFREISVIKDVCINQIYGFGKEGYLKALETLISIKDAS